MAKFIFDAADSAHAVLLVKGLTDLGMVDPAQAKECRHAMEEQGLMHLQEIGHAQVLLGAIDTMKGAGVRQMAAHEDAMLAGSVSKITGKGRTIG